MENNELLSSPEFLSLNEEERSVLMLEIVRTIKRNQTNHLKHHEDREKEERKYYKSLKLLAFSTVVTGFSSLVIGLILILFSWYS